MSSNRTPAKIVLVHGTWGRGFNPQNDPQSGATATALRAAPRWIETGSAFCVALINALSGLVQAPDFTAFLWSGANSIGERHSAARELAEVLDKGVAAAPLAQHFVIAHSHGGNVALAARQAMSNDTHNVHLVTLATPFLFIEQRRLRLLDSIFAACIAFGIIASSAIVLMPYLSSSMASPDNGATLLFDIYFLVSFLSIAIGASVLLFRIYLKLRRKLISDRFRWAPLIWLHQINSRSLAASAALSIAATIFYPSYVGEITVVVFIASLPLIILAFAAISGIQNCLYANDIAPLTTNAPLANLTVLRSRRDEATLALLFARITSFFTRLAASMSIAVSAGAIALILAAIGFVIFLALHYYSVLQDCITSLAGRPNLGQCTMPGERLLVLLSGVLDLWSNTIRHYFSVGLGACIGLLFATALCKSFFGRELIYRSLNTTINVHDTPGGDKSVNIGWCAETTGAFLALRHSLYNNADAIKKIADYIDQKCNPASPVYNNEERQPE